MRSPEAAAAAADEQDEDARLEAERKLEELKRRRDDAESEEFERMRQKQQEAEAELEELKRKREERRKVLEEEERQRKQEEAEKNAREEVISPFFLLFALFLPLSYLSRRYHDSPARHLYLTTTSPLWISNTITSAFLCVPVIVGFLRPLARSCGGPRARLFVDVGSERGGPVSRGSPTPV